MRTRFESFFAKVASVPTRSAKLTLWCEELGRLEPFDSAQLLDECVTGAKTRGRIMLQVYLSILDVREIGERAGFSILSDLLLAAREEELEGTLLVLEHPGEPVYPEVLGPPPDPIVDAMSLGHRKEAARGGRSPGLDRLLRDPDPKVVRELLRNPRLKLEEVLYMASRRPSQREVFTLLARNERWIAHGEVRRAMAQNPFIPPPLALAILPTLLDQDLAAISANKKLHPEVRDGALTVLGWSAR